ncbi:uncharacterized protein LOC110110578 isoform X3 [Dendrobium catenatum]|uniref:uncharacterized protein LOC110110578 isoform X3 n=1 Tax=Dendrobium catenatum TaxID=906689 RepID=UPI00109F6B10|nr:uncharacterized protein LOC110110578 isoform X3 [Dendrobium catenatum]
MSACGKAAAVAVRLFDAHCHLQDQRIFAVTPQIIRTAIDSGVLLFAVNGVSEKDWHIVKQMGEQYPSVIPCFGLHPWFVAERSPEWMRLLREFFAETPSAAVGEIGLDKGSHGRNIEFSQQVEVFRQQLELAKELERPVSIHCVRAFGDLLEIMQCIGPFPAGVILHSFMGSAEMVPAFTQLGSYFSFSGFLTSMKTEKAKKMLKSVSIERILFESDAPDAFPKSHVNSSSLLVDNSIALGHQSPEILATSAPNFPKEELNHPANIQIAR